MKDAQVFHVQSDGTQTQPQVDSSGNQRIVGSRAHDATDSGNPLKIGGVARTANPTAVSNGDRVDAFYDDVGRSVTWPYQVRDLIATAFATLTTNAADNQTSLLAGATGTFHDLMSVTGSNESTNAVAIELREVNLGGAVTVLTIPANSTVAVDYLVPKVQSEAATSWYVDFNANASITDPNDVTNTTVTISATFIKNV